MLKIVSNIWSYCIYIRVGDILKDRIEKNVLFQHCKQCIGENTHAVTPLTCNVLLVSIIVEAVYL